MNDQPKFMTRFEFSRLVAVRTMQLSSGAKPQVETFENESLMDIAIREVAERKVELVVEKDHPNGFIERLELSQFQDIRDY